MNKEQLEGYLLACCDIIDRMIATKQLKEDDVAGKLADNLREYIKLNQPSGWYWYHVNEYPPLYHRAEKTYCKSCGKELNPNELHICNGWTTTTFCSDGTK